MNLYEFSSTETKNKSEINDTKKCPKLLQSPKHLFGLYRNLGQALYSKKAVGQSEYLDHLCLYRLRILDLFNEWDKDRDYIVTRTEFRKGLTESMPQVFTPSQLDLLTAWFDPKGTDMVMYKEFVDLVNSNDQHISY